MSRKSLLRTPSQSKSVRFGGNVKNILHEFNEGFKENYQLLLNQLKDPTLKSSQILEWLKECIACIHLMDRSHAEIVNVLLKVRWMERESEVVSKFSSFLVTLITTNPVHLRAVIKSLTSSFVLDLSRSSDTSFPQKNEKLVFSTLHHVLKTLFTLIPQSKSTAELIFGESFPYMRKPITSLKSYTQNILHVTNYQPDLRPRVLELILRNLIDLDVHSPRQEILEQEEVDDHEDDENEQVFQMDEDFKEKANACSEMKHPLANRLDTLMHMLLQYIYDTCYDGGELQVENARKLFREIIYLFDDIILPIHLLVHVQYIVFYICSFKQSFHESFIEHCWKKVTNVNNPSILRQSAVCYIASLLARANYVSLSAVKACIDTMTTWAHRYLNECTDILSCTSYCCDITRHGTFYSVCQAIFYIIVFRHKQILQSKLGYHYLQSLNLQHLIVSPLNPLKACLSSVVSIFSSTMRQHQIVYCDTIVERNNRQMLPIVGVPSISTNNPLESFFPFDPCLLKRSISFIQPHYKEWDGRSPESQPQDAEGLKDDEFLEEIEMSLHDSESFPFGSLPKQITPSPISSGFGLITPSPF
ncbi:unnamed protein product [Clavelina lepadiformis]|uniref:RNA polymerase I-specific transcription initiation factor RRN3 n=1 Tax=Clavelina lepadiformis TaxID=159417 RepID=A0ABP0G2I9_CLALP